MNCSGSLFSPEFSWPENRRKPSRTLTPTTLSNAHEKPFQEIHHHNEVQSIGVSQG